MSPFKRAPKVIDFDAILADAEAEPVVVHYLDRDWTLYTGMPAKAIVHAEELRQGGGNRHLTLPESLALLAEMVPSDVNAAWLDGGLTVEQYPELFGMITAAYQAGGAEEETASPAADEAV